MDNNELYQAIQKLIEPLEQKITRIDERIDNIQHRVTKIEVSQENVTNKHLQLLTEGHITVVEKLKQLERIDTLEEKVEDIQTTVEVLKYITVNKK